MVKKCILWGVFAACAILLIIGAIHRTTDRLARADDVGQGTGARQGIGGLETVRGTAARANADALVIEWASGEPLLVEGQPWLYAQEQGFTILPGHQVAVTGYDEDGEFKASRIENLTTGQALTLRDDAGRPMWAGRGRNRQ